MYLRPLLRLEHLAVLTNMFCQIYVPLLDIQQWLERPIVQTDGEAEQRHAAAGGSFQLMVEEEERGDHSLTFCQMYVPLLDIPQWIERHIVQTDA